MNQVWFYLAFVGYVLWDLINKQIHKNKQAKMLKKQILWVIYDKYIFLLDFLACITVTLLIIQTVLFSRVVWKGILFPPPESFFNILNPYIS